MMSLLKSAQQASKSTGALRDECQTAAAALFASFIRRDLRRAA